MAKRDTKPAGGARDFLPATLLQRREAIRILENVFLNHGFLPLETPAFERLETLRELYGDEGDKLVFKILRRGDLSDKDEADLADLALRYDLTVPAARAVAQAGLQHNFRRYQMGPVWRAERAAAGRFREFWQCDVDLYGVGSPAGEIETLLALSGGLLGLGVQSPEISINTRTLLTILCEVFSIEEADRKLVLIALDKLDKLGFEKTAEELKTRAEQEAKNAKPIIDLANRLAPDFGAQILAMEEIANSDSLRLLKEIQVCFSGAAIGTPSIAIAPLLARGLDYYTGFIFEIRAEGGKDAIAGGGRYDNLMKTISGASSQICGGSLGLERILALHERGPSEEITGDEPAVKAWARGIMREQAAWTLHLTLFSEELRSATYQLSQDLRLQGLSIFTESGGRLSEQLRRANEAKRRWCILYGHEEIAKECFILRDLNDGTQHPFPLSNLEKAREFVESSAKAIANAT